MCVVGGRTLEPELGLFKKKRLILPFSASELVTIGVKKSEMR